MASHEPTAGTTSLDRLKLGSAAALIVASVAGFYVFDEISWAVRMAGVIVALGIALGLAAFTGPGLRARHFLQESQFELRKVVWPTRQETVQTTIVIMVVVVLFALVLWLVDSLVSWVILDLLLKPGA